MLIKEITNYLEQLAPINLQESYDNAGLLIGSYDNEVNKVLISLDVTDEVIDEAISSNCELIISHHPLIFKGLKKLIGRNITEKLVSKAIKADVAIYAIHTNLDNVTGGVNSILAEKLGIINTKILLPKNNSLFKITCFCPILHTENIQEAMFKEGAGAIGNYNSCSYSNIGVGTFKALEGSNPFVGEINKLHKEEETKLEMIVPNHRLSSVVTSMIAAHPYEEPAFDIYKLNNTNEKIGSGMIGELEKETPIIEYLNFVKKALNIKHVKHNKLIEKPVKRVAICGGSGSFLIDNAANQNADIYISADIKYHDYFEHSGNMTIVDAGHFETEQPVKELLYSLLKKKFPNFALQISEMNVNPISFL